MTRPLEGVRVLDLTNVLMGPLATQMLGDMGADVIKVEAPEGDMVRGVGAGRSRGMGPIFLNLNRSKRSLALDLKQKAAREALLRLAARTDVFVSNVRPKALERLGLGYEAIAAVRPDVIYASLVGYGQDGPYAAWPAYDDLIQGASGVPSLVAAASGEAPRYAPMTMADRMVGLTAASNILAALLYRQKTGQGQHIEIPMFETMATHVLGDHMGGLTYEPNIGGWGYRRLLSRERRPYQTRDGYLCVLVYSDRQWTSFFEAVGRADALEDPRFADISSRTRHIDELYRELAGIMTTRTTAEWLELMRQFDIPAMELKTPETLLADPHLQAVGLIGESEHPTEGRVRTFRDPTRWSKTQPASLRPTPRLGQHNEEILREAGFSGEDIASLRASGALGASEV